MNNNYSFQICIMSHTVQTKSSNGIYGQIQSNRFFSMKSSKKGSSTYKDSHIVQNDQPQKSQSQSQKESSFNASESISINQRNWNNNITYNYIDEQQGIFRNHDNNEINNPVKRSQSQMIDQNSKDSIYNVLNINQNLQNYLPKINQYQTQKTKISLMNLQLKRLQLINSNKNLEQLRLRQISLRESEIKYKMTKEQNIGAYLNMISQVFTIDQKRKFLLKQCKMQQIQHVQKVHHVQMKIKGKKNNERKQYTKLNGSDVLKLKNIITKLLQQNKQINYKFLEKQMEYKFSYTVIKEKGKLIIKNIQDIQNEEKQKRGLNKY